MKGSMKQTKPKTPKHPELHDFDEVTPEELQDIKESLGIFDNLVEISEYDLEFS
jgi:hypothetical protein